VLGWKVNQWELGSAVSRLNALQLMGPGPGTLDPEPGPALSRSDPGRESAERTEHHQVERRDRRSCPCRRPSTGEHARLLNAQVSAGDRVLGTHRLLTRHPGAFALGTAVIDPRRSCPYCARRRRPSCRRRAGPGIGRGPASDPGQAGVHRPPDRPRCGTGTAERSAERAPPPLKTLRQDLPRDHQRPAVNENPLPVA
jgi:hypothetical protein